VPVLAENYENIVKQWVREACSFRWRESVKKPADHCRRGRFIFGHASLDSAAKADFL